MKLSFFNSVQELNKIINNLKIYLTNNKYGNGSCSDFNSQVNNSNHNALINPAELFDEEEFEEVEENPKVIECKKTVCEILYFALKIQNELRVNEFFKKLKDLVTNEPHLFEQGNSDSSPSLVNVISGKKQKSNKDVQQELIKRTSQILDEVMNAKSKLDIEKDKLFPTLYELFLYKDTHLKTKALELINELYSQNNSLGETLIDIQIIDDQVSLNKYEKAMDSSFILNTIGDIMEKWYEEPDAVELGHLVILLNMLYKN